MTELDSAIMTVFNAVTGVAPNQVHHALYLALYDTSISVMPRFFNEEAQQSTGMNNDGMPYVVFHEIVNICEPKEFSKEQENFLMQFNIHASDIVTLNSIYDKLKTVFDNCTLSYTSYKHIYMKRENAYRLHSDRHWVIAVEYRVLLEAN